MNQVAFHQVEDVASCGCDVPDSQSTDQGIVPNVVSERNMSETVSTAAGQPTTFMMNGVPAPQTVTINFNTYGGMMPMPAVNVPSPHMNEDEEYESPESGTMVKVSDGKTVIKILNEKSDDKAGCYFDDDGSCVMCGAPSETIYAAAVDKPYGKVKYADPGYRDGKARYPIDTEAHVRAALAYINMPKNASKYTPEQLENIKERIHAAAKKYGIEVSDAEDAETGMGVAPADMALLAGAAPLAPPSSWFSDPKLTEPTKLTITKDGRVYGHLAQWRTCHVGIGNACVVAPKSHTKYSLFKVGSLLCDDGTQMSVGKIVMGSAHANAQWGVMPARDFYDNTSMTAAIVNVGEDKHGIWINGMLTPDMTPEKIVSLRASALSGDWRAINGNLELIAALAVNSPGFPIYRESAGRAFSIQAIGVVGFDDETGEFSMAQEPEIPTGINEDRAALFAQLQELEGQRTEYLRSQRFAQLATLDEEREKLSDNKPRTYSTSPAIRGQYNNPRVRMLPEPDDAELDDELQLEDAEDQNEDEGNDEMARKTKKKRRRPTAQY